MRYERSSKLFMDAKQTIPRYKQQSYKTRSILQEILILDEATSALDNVSETEVHENQEFEVS